MTATNPRSRTPFRLASAAGFAALLLLSGCKSNKDGGTSPTKSRDPLVHGPRIPAQNLPVPERGGIGVKGTKNDPLLDKPVGRGSDKSGLGYSDDPERFKGTYVPGAASTPAAMAGKWKDGDELKIDTPDDRVPLRRAGGEDVKPAGGLERPVEPPAESPAESLEPLYAQLQKFDVPAADRSLRQENGRHVFRAAVPLKTGAKRHYEGVGATAAEAVKQVLDQVASDPR